MPNRDGFTLIELLLVIIIVGLLVTIATPRLWGSKNEALLRAVYNDLKAFALHQELYHERHLTYTNDPDALENFQRTEGVEIDVDYAEPTGWLAIGRHAGLTTQCVMFIGSVPPSDPPSASQEGVVECN